ncbi:MAG: hypothetical protein K0S60_526 [Evtepia sp.]|nr:hypothetical protein [Evtepia sp.]
MEINKMVRTIDELGRVVLPREVRENLDWKEKTKVEVKVDKERKEVILKSLAPNDQ